MPEVIDYDEVARNQAAADEIREPGITARRAAAYERERIVREARATTERQYKAQLTLIAQGQQADPVELTRLATALGRSEKDVADDAEMRAAEIEDEKETARCEEERADLEQQIAEQDRLSEQARAEQNRTHNLCNGLDKAIAQEHAKVALQKKAERAKAVAQNRAAIADVEKAKAKIADLQQAIADVRPRCDHVEQLKFRRFQAVHEARQRESDRAMAPYVFASQADSLPDEAIRAAISPSASQAPPTVDLAGRKVDPKKREASGSIRLGMIDGEEVRVSVGELG